MKLTMSSIEGNGQKLDGGAMFGNAPRALWSRWKTPDELGRIDLSCRALLIESEDLKILCETGIGAFFEPKMAERFGVQEPQKHRLLDSLNRLGVSEQDIDYVVLSHLHFDHAGGLLPTYDEIQSGKDRLLFPKAQYLVGQQAWERALRPHSRDRASFIPGLTDKLKSSGRLVLIEEQGERPSQLPFMDFFWSQGHTPGQMHTLIHGDDDSVFFAGDLIPGVPWVNLPITMGYDRYPEKLIDEKQQLYQTAIDEKWWIFFTHDSEVSCGKIQSDQKGKYSTYEDQKSVQRREL